MLDIEDWGYNPAWLEYVLDAHPRNGRVSRTDDDHPARLEFKERARQAFDEKEISYSYIKTYVSIQSPSEGGGYDPGYPHQHSPLSGTSLIHYLQPGDVPAPLHVLDDEKGSVIFEYFPERGMTVFMPHHLWHGVLKNHGKEDRIQIIASAI